MSSPVLRSPTFLIVVVVLCVMYGNLSLDAGTREGALKKQTSTSSMTTVPVIPAKSESLTTLTSQVQQLDYDVSRELNRPREDNSKTNLWTGIIAALAVLLTSFIALFGQYLIAKKTAQVAREEALRKAELARLEARYKNIERFVEYRLKQMELFYAPLSALMAKVAD